MVRRYSRARDAAIYTLPMFGKDLFAEVLFPQSWNIAPGTVQPVIYCGGPTSARWGFVPVFAGTRRPMLTSCRLDDKNSETWKTMCRIARLIVPADGWYEWLATDGVEQPYFIKPKDGGPVFLAALSSYSFDEEAQATDGFVMVSSSTDVGIVNSHSHRPVVLNAFDAVRWLHPKTTFGLAKKIAADSIMPRQMFRSFEVSVGVNSVRNDEPAFNDPLSDGIAMSLK
ncbi:MULTISPECIES: SOS response-associated peptidase [Burkholderiaceae]|nr:SOS response-associated peptidase family protein [Caballeronia sordidicola]